MDNFNIINETEFENIVVNNSTVDENTTNENISNNTVNQNTTNDEQNVLLNETTENTIVDENSVTLETIHNDLGLIVSFFCIFSVVILVKIVLKFFNIFF